MMPADRGLHHGRIQSTACNQTGYGRIPIGANASAMMAEAPASCRRADDRRSSICVRERSDDGESRADRIFQPNSGEADRFQCPVNSERFNEARDQRSGASGVHRDSTCARRLR